MHQHHLPLIRRITLLWCLAVAILGVTVLWGFWTRALFGLGLNAFVVAIAILGLFEWRMRNDGMRFREYATWFVPFVLIAASFVLYVNPFLKAVSILITVPLFALFAAHGRNPEGAKAVWDVRYVSRLVLRSFSWLVHVPKVVHEYGDLPTAPRDRGVYARVAVGLLVFAFIALVFVLPLLSAADAEFARWTREFTEWFFRLFDSSIVTRAIVAVLATIVMASCVAAWMRPLAYKAQDEKKGHADPIIAGIVIGGMLGLYALFLLVQAKSLLVGSLPTEFALTERLVKGGFWQLLTLTGLNILVCWTVYGRTTRGVGRLLTAFGAASLLLLLSAAHRVWLYVAFYGFSYEKFFAAYAVLYCGILLGWLASRMVRAGRADIAKFAAFQFLWMYALLTAFPVEQFVLRANLALARMPESQIRLYELTMLSSDVLGTVEDAFREGRLRERDAVFSREAVGHADFQRADGQADWTWWIINQREKVGFREWYEMTVSDIAYSLKK